MIQNYFGLENKDGFYVTQVITGTQAQVNTNYGVFFIAKNPCEILKVSLVYAVTNGGEFTLDVEKLTGTTAPGSGTTVLASQFDLNSTANTVYERKGTTLTSVSKGRTLKENDRLALKPTATGGYVNISEVCVSIYLRPLGKGHYS